MKGSLIVIAVFAAGILAGFCDLVPTAISGTDVAIGLLYLLIIIVGLDFGHNGLSTAMHNVSPLGMLLPLTTVVGTLVASALTWLIIGGYSLTDFLAIGCGMGYYSLSSVLITDYRLATHGPEIASQLATLALLTNIARELLGLALAPVFKRFGGPLAPIAASGATSMDVALPVIARVCGNSAIPYAVINGIVLEMSVPLLIMIFCSF